MEDLLNGLYASWPVVAALGYLGYQMHKYVLATETRIALIEEKIEVLEKHDHGNEPCLP